MHLPLSLPTSIRTPVYSSHLLIAEVLKGAKVDVTLKTRRCYKSHNFLLVLHLFFCTCTSWSLLSLEIYWTAASFLSDFPLDLMLVFIVFEEVSKVNLFFAV